MFTSTCPQYPRFMISGVTLGLYVFALNPSEYNPYPDRQTKQYKTIMDFDPTTDINYKKIPITMSWEFMPEQQWVDLEPYYRKKTDGSSEDTYFWDGTTSGFVGDKIKVSKFIGSVVGGFKPIDRMNVEMEIRRI